MRGQKRSAGVDGRSSCLLRLMSSSPTTMGWQRQSVCGSTAQMEGDTQEAIKAMRSLTLDQKLMERPATEEEADRLLLGSAVGTWGTFHTQVEHGLLVTEGKVRNCSKRANQEAREAKPSHELHVVLLSSLEEPSSYHTSTACPSQLTTVLKNSKQVLVDV